VCGCTYTSTLYFEEEEEEDQEEAKRQVSSTQILTHIFLLGFNNIELSGMSGSLAVADTRSS
jgi:hypothetical protein